MTLARKSPAPKHKETGNMPIQREAREPHTADTVGPSHFLGGNRAGPRLPAQIARNNMQRCFYLERIL